METKDNIHLQCDCYSEIMVCSFNKYQDIKEFDFAIFSYGNYNPKPTLLNRLKHAFQIVWFGRYYTDNICLNEAKAKELQEFLKNHL